MRDKRSKPRILDQPIQVPPKAFWEDESSADAARERICRIQFQERINALAEFFSLDMNDPNFWEKLAIALAERQFDGCRVVTEYETYSPKGGRPRFWTPPQCIRLLADRAALKRLHDGQIGEAECSRQLAKKPRYAEEKCTPTNIERQFRKLPNSAEPIWSYFRSRSQDGYDGELEAILTYACDDLADSIRTKHNIWFVRTLT
jgi:hypothetical protein